MNALHPFSVARPQIRGVLVAVMAAALLSSPCNAVTPGVASDLDGDGRSDQLTFQLTQAGWELTVVTKSWRSNITGLPFEPGDTIHAAVHDLNGDGLGDVVLSNVRATSEAASRRVRSPGSAEWVPQVAWTVRKPTVLSIVTPRRGLPAHHNLAPARGGLLATDVRGDRDNFGYGAGIGVPPCEFFDNREPEDLEVFDYENSNSQEAKIWTHSIDVLGIPAALVVRVNEIFSESIEVPLIDVDGHLLRFAFANFAECDTYPPGGVRRIFVLLGEDAGVASDGSVPVTLFENGDNIALEGAVLAVQFE